MHLLRRLFPLVVAVLWCSLAALGQTITSLSPTSQYAGFGSSLPITISGSGFGSVQGNGNVKFNGVTATLNSWSDTSISANVPFIATSGNVTVTAGGVQSNGVFFTVLPSINVLLPSSGAVGSVVNISGAGFGPSQGTGGITLNGAPVSVNSWSTNNVFVTVPTGASSGSMVVTTDAGLTTSNAFTFTVVPPPALPVFLLPAELRDRRSR